MISGVVQSADPDSSFLHLFFFNYYIINPVLGFLIYNFIYSLIGYEIRYLIKRLFL